MTSTPLTMDKIEKGDQPAPLTDEQKLYLETMAFPTWAEDGPPAEREAHASAIAERMAKISVAAGRHVAHAVMMNGAEDVARSLNERKIGPLHFRKMRLLGGARL